MPGILHTLYRPISKAYHACAGFRNSLYAKGLLKSFRLPAKVISIGNLTMGGTGKTPMVAYAAGILAGDGHRVAVLSRGYKGTLSRPVEIVSNGTGKILVEEKIAGDEPVVLARNLPGIPVLVSPNRRMAGALAISSFGAEILILDDGFQHLQLKRDLDMVLIDVTRPFGDHCVPPFGILREPVTGIGRADAIVLTRTNLPHDETGIVDSLRTIVGALRCGRAARVERHPW